MEQAQRARSDAQKQQRRQAILDAAWEMYQGTPYEAITIANVAERVGVAKGTFYLYFRTKEELFLALQQEQLNAWFEALDERLQRRDGIFGPDELARLLGDSVTAQPQFTRLLAILHPIIEQNIDREAARAFKLFLQRRLATSGTLIEQHLPHAVVGSGAELLQWVYALVIGFRHMADPAPIVREVLEDPALAGMLVDFDTGFAAALRAIINGLAHKEPSNGS